MTIKDPGQLGVSFQLFSGFPWFPSVVFARKPLLLDLNLWCFPTSVSLSLKTRSSGYSHVKAGGAGLARLIVKARILCLGLSFFFRGQDAQTDGYMTVRAPYGFTFEEASDPSTRIAGLPAGGTRDPQGVVWRDWKSWFLWRNG